MTDNRIEKIRAEIERLKSQLLKGACSSQVAMETRCKEEAYNEVLTLLNAMLEDSLSKENKESWNERLDKKDFRERYKRIAQSESFKKAYKGISIGDAIPVENEEPVSKVWHDASEKPKEENKPIAIKLHCCEVWSPYIVEEMSQGWDVFKENVDIKEWAYVDDILKL